MFCRPRESIRSGSSLKALGSAVGVSCDVDSHLLLAVKSLWSSSEVCVRVGKNKSWLFTVGIRLRQGCVLSPLLFRLHQGSQTTARIRSGNQFNPTCQIPCTFFSSATFPTVDSSATALAAACHVNSVANWYIHSIYQFLKCLVYKFLIWYIYGIGGAGVQPHTQNFWFGENLGKIF